MKFHLGETLMVLLDLNKLNFRETFNMKGFLKIQFFINKAFSIANLVSVYLRLCQFILFVWCEFETNCSSFITSE